MAWCGSFVARLFVASITIFGSKYHDFLVVILLRKILLQTILLQTILLRKILLLTTNNLTTKLLTTNPQKKHYAQF